MADVSRVQMETLIQIAREGTGRIRQTAALVRMGLCEADGQGGFRPTDRGWQNLEAMARRYPGEARFQDAVEARHA